MQKEVEDTGVRQQDAKVQVLTYLSKYILYPFLQHHEEAVVATAGPKLSTDFCLRQLLHYVTNCQIDLQVVIVLMIVVRGNFKIC